METRISVKGTVMWAMFKELDTKTKKYGMKLCNLSGAAVEALEDAGITVRDGEVPNLKGSLNPSWGRYIILTCKDIKFPTTGPDKEKIDLKETELGNGTVATVRVFPCKMGAMEKIEAKISSIKVHELVEWDGDGAEDDEEGL